MADLIITLQKKICLIFEPQPSPYLDHVVVVAGSADLAKHGVQLVVEHQSATVVKGGPINTYRVSENCWADYKMYHIKALVLGIRNICREREPPYMLQNACLSVSNESLNKN